jgi:hypothetical protein
MVMGKGKKPAALSIADEALARRQADLIGQQVRAALWEHRQIESGLHRELDAEEVQVQ